MRAISLHRAALGFIAAASIATLALAQSPGADPLDGTWQLNVARSNMSGPGASASETIVFKVEGDVESFESHAVQTSDGAAEHTGYKAVYGGPPVPMASIYVLPSGVVSKVDIAQVKVIKVDSHTRERIATDANGRQILRSQRKLSADGKRMDAALLDTNGKVVQTRSFDRIK